MSKALPPVLDTPRLILRPFELADIESSWVMNKDAEVSRYTGDGGVVSRDEMERRIREDVMGDYEKYGFGRLAVEVKGGERFIGFAGLKYLEDLKEVDLGYRLMKKYWGRGYATEAASACLDYGFDQLNLSEIIAMVLPANTASIRVLEKLGFTYSEDRIEDGTKMQVFKLTHDLYQKHASLGSSV